MYKSACRIKEMFYACLGHYDESKNAYDDLYTDSNTTYVQTNNWKCKAKI